MAHELKEISEFVNAINKIELAQVEVEIGTGDACGLTKQETIKVEITPLTHELKEIPTDKKTEA